MESGGAYTHLLATPFQFCPAGLGGQLAQRGLHLFPLLAGPQMLLGPRRGVHVVVYRVGRHVGAHHAFAQVVHRLVDRHAEQERARGFHVREVIHRQQLHIDFLGDLLRVGARTETALQQRHQGVVMLAIQRSHLPGMGGRAAWARGLGAGMFHAVRTVHQQGFMALGSGFRRLPVKDVRAGGI
jgi:hypothetical protein